MATRIVSVATSNPPLCMTQTKVLEEVLRHHDVSADAKERYRQFFDDNGIETRYFGFEKVAQVFSEPYDQTVERFACEATKIGQEAVMRALSAAGIAASNVDALFVTTCTGYLCPGLSSYVSQALGLKSETYLVDMVGQGCAAAIPALRAADYYLQSHPKSRAVCLCVEICSAAFSDGEATELLISNVIFGDGAAACVLSHDEAQPGVELKRYVTLLEPQYRDELRFKTRNSRLCNVLSRNVPVITARAVEHLRKDVLPADEKADHYAFHGGGRAIMDRIEKTMGYGEKEMGPSRTILKRYGNMSSPSVLFVLKEILETQSVKPGANIVMFSYGAGFTAHGVWGQWRA